MSTDASEPVVNQTYTASPPTPGQLRKDEAEASKAEAEAAVAEEKAKAELAKVLAEARAAEAEARLKELSVAGAERKERDELAADKHHHFYAFNEAVSASSVKKCVDQLVNWIRCADGNKLDIEIMFNSPGGSVIDGMALWDYIQTIKAQGHHVVTSTVGMAASMAGILLQAGDERVMGKEAYLLIHEISFGIGGKIGEVEDEVEFIKKIQERVIRIFAAKSMLTERQIKSRWRRKDWWLDSDEALRLGFVDSVR